LKNGFIAFDMITPPNEDVRKITIKMSYAFDQAYTRFLDLQKAEAQAREAQIEAALEKVRSRTMAMQRSEELPEVAALLFQQVKALGVPQFHCGFNIFEIDDKECTWYPGSADGDILPPCKIPLTEHPVFMNFIESRKRGDELCVYEKEGEYQAGHYRYMLSLPVLGEILQNMLDAGIPFPTFQIDHLANFSHGNLLFITSEHFPEMHDTFKRFAKVFEQTYTRFLDLQKAEAQAREAQIEAALEKVRSRTMAMQRSEELSETAAVLFQEFKKFGNSDLIQTTIGIYHEEQGVIEFRVTDWAGGGNQIGESFLMSMEEPIVLKPAVTAWKAKEKSFVADLTGKELEGWINYRNKMTGVTISSADTRGRRIITLSFFSKGHLSISSPLPLPEKTISTLERFASVFDGTYTRFLDLQKAETQAKVAIKQSSLDRIRGEIASMRTTKDLERITPLIWKELTTLNIPFIRCGVFIMDEMMQQIHTFLSTPDGKAIAAFHLPYDAPGRTREILAGWINKQAYIEHWDEADFSELGDLLVQQGALPSKDVYMKTIPAGGLYLHCLPFLQGMLYVGNTIALKEDDIQLIQSIADAFATAYARYEDFNKLEAAKQQVDKALVELKQTQQQLVQSEKMASLGELTAGIAHEIQNPLNFVNNFSEVSTELVKEMVEEAEKGNSEEVKAIAFDVAQNLEKINHHGKRAADIVKGMLQHSRTSSGQKELTNINELADEYLRLAYHGLRAKDKSFNARFETNLDPTLPKLNVIPQDIGRVLLNLINNAFYAVTLRHSKGDNSYQPTVWVSTKYLGDKIEISVKDNGNGIPDSIKEKIFQPFFTTKPTGQGTGLGLSLSYDIVKTHGGELKVETKEGVESVFVIQLPIA
jgi:signal transduction histidine kinase